MLGRAVLVAETDVFLGKMGVRSRADGSRVRISQVADEKIVSGVPAGFTQTVRSATLVRGQLESRNTRIDRLHRGGDPMELVVATLCRGGLVPLSSPTL